MATGSTPTTGGAPTSEDDDIGEWEVAGRGWSWRRRAEPGRELPREIGFGGGADWDFCGRWKLERRCVGGLHGVSY